VCLVLFIVCLYICVRECLLQSNNHKTKHQNNSNPFHRIEFGPPKFFSKTFRFSIIFYSIWENFGGGHFRKVCRSRKKESKQSEITCKQSEPARTISEIEKRRESVRALCYQQCPKNSFKRLYIVKELLFLVEKAHLQKNIGRNFNAVERVRLIHWNSRKVNVQKFDLNFWTHLEIIEVSATVFLVFRIYLMSQRKQTNLFSILLNCSIPEQLFLRTIVFDHPRLIHSNLICRHRAPTWCL